MFRIIASLAPNKRHVPKRAATLVAIPGFG